MAFRVRWPLFARLDAGLLFVVTLALLATTDQIASALQEWLVVPAQPYLVRWGLVHWGIAAHHLFWVALVLVAAIPYLALMTVAERLLTVRKGFALLSLLAIAAWAAAAAALSDDLPAIVPGWTSSPAMSAAVIAGGAALLLHVRPLWMGLRDRGFIGARLLARSNAMAAWQGPTGSRLGRTDLWSGEAHASRAWLAPNPRAMQEDRPRTTLFHALAWCGVFAGLLAAYTYRHDLTRFIGPMIDELAPGRSIQGGAREAIAVRLGNGHFAFNATLNGVPMPMMFDTGATFVTLRAEDAARIGIDPDQLRYSVVTKTANGVADVAPIMIDTLTVGGISQRQVPGVVARRGALDQNLLGQTFLSRLASYGVERNRLTLRGY